MGKPPCEYAVVGMGSLAREEITPYSDFEHIILLSDDENYASYLNYFKWYSVIFHITVLNLKESIIPSLNVSSLNDNNCRLKDWFYDDITPRGISFDGMMPHACKFPLGRQKHTQNKQFTTELIKPVSEMLKYLSSEADLKNGYHLADILTKTCFVFGNENIFKQFIEGSKKFRDQISQIDIAYKVQRLVKSDLNKFSTRFQLSDLKSQNTINIKQLVYRSTTIFIAALARLHNISANSCFDIIDIMEKQETVTQNTAYKLRCAIAIACEIRLRVYMKKKSQCDNPIDLKKDGIEEFLNVVGEASTVIYFQIAYCLQCEVAKQLNFTKFDFYSHSHLINCTIGLAFGMKKMTVFSKNLQTGYWDSKEFDFDTCIKELETETRSNSGSLLHYSLKQTPRQIYLALKQIVVKILRQYCFIVGESSSIGYYCALFLNRQISFLQFYRHLVNSFQRIAKRNACFRHLLHTNKSYNTFMKKLAKQPEIASTYLNQMQQSCQNSTFIDKNYRDMAEVLYRIGCCYIHLQHYDDALMYLNRALEINQNTIANSEMDCAVAETFRQIGRCHIDLHNYNDALIYLNRALKIYQNIAHKARKKRILIVMFFFSLTRIFFVIFITLLLSFTNDFLISYLTELYKVFETRLSTPAENWDIAVTLYELGRCHTDLHNNKKALTFLRRALEIFPNTTIDNEKDRNVAATLREIGRCYVDMSKYDEALIYLNQALTIYQNSSTDLPKDCDLAATQLYISKCFTDTQKFDDSCICLDQSLKIFRNATLNKEKDVRIAIALSLMGEQLMETQNYSKAVLILQRAIKIYCNSDTNAKKSLLFANTLCTIGRCCMKMQMYADARNYLEESLKVYKYFPLNDHTTSKATSIQSIINGLVLLKY